MLTYLKLISFSFDQAEIKDIEQPSRLSYYVRSKAKYLFFKRIFDIVASSLVIVFILSWLFPLMALLIKATSKGPVFFVQRRVGRTGKTFKCLKFRTMIINARADIRQADERDERITRLGKFLRISNIDEFPQFINVLLGDMSIVGPRPHMHADTSRFSAAIPGYKFRNMVKPGITGLAQVKGYRGPTKDFASMFHRYQFDAFYIRNMDLWLDMRIVRQTIVQTLKCLKGRLVIRPAATGARVMPGRGIEEEKDKGWEVKNKGWN
jgi:putative colanic acid biosynthesis UDP-glucose lipid carrier transferase